MSSRPVRRPTSRDTHAELARRAAEGQAAAPERPPSLEALDAADRAAAGCKDVVLVALRIAPAVTLEGPEDLAERVGRQLHGQWVRVFGSPHQMFAVGAWPAPEGWTPADPFGSAPSDGAPAAGGEAVEGQALEGVAPVPSSSEAPPAAVPMSAAPLVLEVPQLQNR